MDARDQAYYLKRIVQEQEAAANAASAVARERHEELAAAYRYRCRADPGPVVASESMQSGEVGFAA